MAKDTKSLRAASDAVAIVDKENVDLEKCGRKRKSSERHQYNEHTKVEIVRCNP